MLTSAAAGAIPLQGYKNEWITLGGILNVSVSKLIVCIKA